MVEVTLTIYSPAGSREYQMTGSQLSIGRGSDVTLHLNDDGLSRHHATIYREGERVWILDEVSTNGTYLNGARVPASGSPLADSDEIAIGNDTTIAVSIRQVVERAPVSKKQAAADATGGTFKVWPIVAALAAVFVILIAAFALGSRVSSSSGGDDEETANNRQRTRRTTELPPPDNNNSTTPAPSSSTNANDLLPPEEDTTKNILPAGKTYLEMSEEEKRKYVEHGSERVARMIGNREAEAVTPEAALKIKAFVDTYARRLKSPRLGGSCNFPRDDLTTLLTRGSRNAPFIIHAFNEKGLDPQIGLYLAMIESEYCICLQSPTGPLGMYQFTQATGRTYGLRIVAGASPSNPDERCQPEPSARAAAGYIKFLIGRYGTGPRSVPLAIASYNSGEGGLSQNLEKALSTAGQQERSFWTLLAQADRLSEQFQRENKNYPTKFFAAAIVGENPQVFGVQLQPLSSYTQ
ncbi:MAG: transglycosylase SLT domain-containing protein [Acidobacteria bacterium]|nr:transglycosylase SLT domain-containing protein [Acidobacteriota bacterium]